MSETTNISRLSIPEGAKYDVQSWLNREGWWSHFCYTKSIKDAKDCIRIFRRSYRRDKWRIVKLEMPK